jgi:Amino acid synthesis
MIAFNPDLAEPPEKGLLCSEVGSPRAPDSISRDEPTEAEKEAIVGAAGEMEHGGACVHPMLGKPMRAAIGGGKAVIGSNVKVAAAGASLDVPLGHKDDSWSFQHFDTITVSVADAPRPDEILVVMAIADGGRLRNRCGTEPIR